MTTPREQIIEVMARAYVNATKPEPVCIGNVMDAYDLLKSWAAAGIPKVEGYSIGYGPDWEAHCLAKEELGEAHKTAEAALTALEQSGYIVRPREATEGMIDKGWRKFDKYAKPQNRCCNMDRAMTEHWLKEYNGD